MKKHALGVAVVLMCLTAFVLIQPETSAKASDSVAGSLKIATSPAFSGKDIDRVLLIVHPGDSLVSQVMEDIVTKELMSAGLSVVSREQHALISAQELVKQDQLSATTAPAAESSQEIVDLTKIARAAGANAIVTITALTNVIQSNVYNASGRIDKVVSRQIPEAISLTIVNAHSGELLISAYEDYTPDQDVSIAKASVEIGSALGRLLKD